MVLDPLVAYLHTQLGRCSGIIESTSLAVCYSDRIRQHQEFAGCVVCGMTYVS